MEKIRDYSDSNVLKPELLKQHQDWDSLTGAMDVIEDTQLGIEEYQKMAWGKSDGRHYLMIYGVFQCLYVQQLALETMGKVFSLEIDQSYQDTLDKLRDV